MKYAMLDFRDLVTAWYNDFLPEAFEGSLLFLERADIVYLNSLPLGDRREDSLEFLMDRAGSMVDSLGVDVGIVVQEPKPVNNVRNQKFLRFVDESGLFSESARSRILHVANMRYVVSSKSVLISDVKSIGQFLDRQFEELMMLSRSDPSHVLFPNDSGLRFIQSPSLGMGDVAHVASQFFLKGQLKQCQNSIGQHIQVNSSSDVLVQMSNQTMRECSADKRTDRFVEICQKALLSELGKII